MSEHKERDIIEQGDYYSRHTSAMTGEDLHRKSDIAAELAHRDIEIDRLKAENEALQARVAELEACARGYSELTDSICEDVHAVQHRIDDGEKVEGWELAEIIANSVKREEDLVPSDSSAAFILRKQAEAVDKHLEHVWLQIGDRDIGFNEAGILESFRELTQRLRTQADELEAHD